MNKKVEDKYWNKDMTLEEVVDANMGIVINLANRFKNLIEYDPALDVDDLIQIGCIGLMKAYDTYIGEDGARFSTYASRCISNEILMNGRKTKRYYKLIETSVNEDRYIDFGDKNTKIEKLDLVEDSDSDFVSDIVKDESRKNLKKNLIDKLYENIKECYSGNYSNWRRVYPKKVDRLLGILEGYYQEIDKRDDYNRIKHSDIYNKVKHPKTYNAYSNWAHYARHLYVLQAFICDTLHDIGEEEMYKYYKKLLSNDPAVSRDIRRIEIMRNMKDK